MSKHSEVSRRSEFTKAASPNHCPTNPTMKPKCPPDGRKTLYVQSGIAGPEKENELDSLLRLFPFRPIPRRPAISLLGPGSGNKTKAARPLLPKINKPFYCNYEGVPTIIGETRAWVFVKGAWKEVDRTEVYTKAQLIGEPEFRRLFGQLPPLPMPFPSKLQQ